MLEISSIDAWAIQLNGGVSCTHLVQWEGICRLWDFIFVEGKLPGKALQKRSLQAPGTFLVYCITQVALVPGCVHTSQVESKSHHVFKHLYFSLYTSLRRPLNCLNTNETACDIAILRRRRNCNPARAVKTNRNGSNHSKTRRWLDFFKYVYPVLACKYCLGLYLCFLLWYGAPEL